MKSDSRPATIYDVARHAGVSHQTVTRLLSGFEGIRPATRARVEEAIQALEYRPNQAARLLRTNRSNRIGALAHEMTKSGPSAVIQGASRRAHEAGYVLDIVIVDGYDDRSIRDALGVLERERVAGILVTAQTEQMRQIFLSIPIKAPMQVGSHVDDEAGRHGLQRDTGRIAARHLIELGHRRILVIAGARDWLSTQERLEGFESVCRDAGVETVIEYGDWSPESGYRIALDLDLESGITAVFAQNDHMALGAIRALHERGCEVPRDLSVVGVDDIPEARFLTPPLTTIAIDFEAEGRFAIDWLVSRIESTEPPKRERAPMPRLVTRESARRF
ncbi:LacI family DNA-binding transcriptional regulator [Agreia sp. PsM10]|uniref:LacI family DNA-binding transcriptional regulator n=1 Tax=Agreia sp. PsM10 TaxID=3030533 RepID=UPI00263BC2FD|nr:LacI family DNA-binding transcriptional regulator [Agreia sp. PsM10]MDN4642155.1 LacI family DNA-binding transcriptional regulator [Agreia sp. PsM10]